MAKKSAQVIDMQFSKDTKELQIIVHRRAQDKLRGGELLAKHEAMMKKNSLWVKWLSDDIGISEDTAERWIEIYKQNQGSDSANAESSPRKQTRISSGRRIASTDGRGRGGGGGTHAADTAAAAATSPANPAAGTPIPATGQEGARATSAPSASIPSVVSSGPLRKAADGQGEADKRSAAFPASSQDLARLFDQDLALAEALKLIEKLERANALLQAAVDKSDIEAAQAADASEKRISGLLEKLRERDMRIVELEAQIAAGVDASAAKRLSNQAKLIDELRAGEKEARRQADAARSPGPRGLMVLFQRQSIPDQTEFVRALAAIDDPAPGEQDADKVRWAKLIFRKIHNQQVKRDLLNELAAGELAEVLATHTTSITPTSDLKPVDYRRLAEPGALFKKPTNGKSP